MRAVLAVTHYALTLPPLVDRIAEVYELARDYRLLKDAQLHCHLACCAGRLGKREEALFHVRRAIELGFKQMKELHDEDNLVLLRGDPAFEQLFA
jgi:hypothetical protein